MKVIHRPKPEYAGWWVQCQHCHSIVELEKEEELTTHEAGDFKDEGTLKWVCPTCGNTSYGGYSRLKHDSQVLHRHYKD